MSKSAFDGIIPREVTKVLRRQEGLTLLEMGISMALTLMIIAPLATIVWQTTVIPSETSGSITAEIQIRNANIALSDDFRTAQIVKLGVEPFWIFSDWTDFTTASGDYHTVSYEWLDTGDLMVRSTSVNGFGGPKFELGRFLDQFSDVRFEFLGNSPFLLGSSLTPEVDTPLGSQIKTNSSLSFLRAPASPAPPEGGYALFSTAGINLSGNDNAIIGNIHANGEIRISCLRDNVTCPR